VDHIDFGIVQAAVLELLLHLMKGMLELVREALMPLLLWGWWVRHDGEENKAEVAANLAVFLFVGDWDRGKHGSVDGSADSNSQDKK
jgi:hypothetical protein